MADPREMAEQVAVAAVWIERHEVAGWVKNPRTHTARSTEAVKRSMERFGFVAPVVVWTERDQVVAGHGRLKAYDALSADHGSGWAPKHAPGPGLVPVRFMSFDSEKDAADYAIIDNRTTELSEWDMDLLAEVVREFDSVDDTLRGLDLWSEDEIASIVAEFDGEVAGGDGGDGGSGSPKDPSDDFKTEDVPAITQSGEIVSLGRHTLACMDCIEFMRTLPDNSVDAIVTDPPYGLSPDGRARTWDDLAELRASGKGPKGGFMGRAWDAGVPGLTWARECLRVLKPGGHVVAFSATRTIHRLTTAIEDAGFEVRDQIAWAQWQGFPKSMNIAKAIDKADGVDGVSHYSGPNNRNKVYNHGMGSGLPPAPYEPVTTEAKKWAGWGTAVKPAYEPAVLARKPLDGTVIETVLKHGTGAMNIDGCRYATGDPAWPGPNEPWRSGDPDATPTPTGATWGGSLNARISQYNDLGRFPANIYACPKPGTNERQIGCDTLPARKSGNAAGPGGREALADPGKVSGNVHPTVKPIRLMRWLVRLVTPPGGTVLEPFGGSGTTLLAAEAEGVTCLATEMEPVYCDIIRARYHGHTESDD